MITIEALMNVRVYLYIPHRDKEKAINLGCKWDASRKKWYCIDSDKGENNITSCLQLWGKHNPYKIINGYYILLSDIPFMNRGFTT